MEAGADAEARLIVSIDELQSTFERLRLDHNLAEAMLIARTVAHGVFGADSKPVCEPSASEPHSTNDAPPLSRSQKRRRRESAEVKAAKSAARATKLKAKRAAARAEAEATEFGAHGEGHEANKPSHDKVPPSTTTVINPPITPPKQPPTHDDVQHAAALEMGRGKRGPHDRSPLPLLASPSSAPTLAKRATGPSRQLMFADPIDDMQDAEKELARAKQRPTDAQRYRAAVCAAIAANTRWHPLAQDGLKFVYERIIRILSNELQWVEPSQWNTHLVQRLGKVAGGVCSEARVVV